MNNYIVQTQRYYQNEDDEYVPSKEDWEQDEYDVSNDKFTAEEQDQTMTDQRYLLFHHYFLLK